MTQFIDAAMLITLEPNGGGDVHNYIYTQIGAPNCTTKRIFTREIDTPRGRLFSSKGPDILCTISRQPFFFYSDRSERKNQILLRLTDVCTDVL